MSDGFYILIGRDPVPVSHDQFIQWATWFELAHTNVSRTVIPAKRPLKKGHPRMRNRLNFLRTQPVTVSTVFLGLDHNFWGGRPLVFETMIFGGRFDSSQWRWATWDDAQMGHDSVVTALLRGKS